MTAPDPSPDPAVEGLAAWWNSFDGPAYPSGREFAEALLTSDYLAARDAAQQRIGAERALREARASYLRAFENAPTQSATHVLAWLGGSMISEGAAARVEQARQAHAALWMGKKLLPLRNWLKSHDTSRAYRYALLAAAHEELDRAAVRATEERVCYCGDGLCTCAYPEPPRATKETPT